MSATMSPISIKFGILMQKLIIKIQDGGGLLHLRDLFGIVITYRDFSFFKIAAVSNGQ